MRRVAGEVAAGELPKELVTEMGNIMNGRQIALAIEVFTPFLRTLIFEAERSGEKGSSKHTAVSAGAEKLWGRLQGSMHELENVTWVDVSPILLPVADGLITILVELFNSLFGKIWKILSGVFTKEE